MRGLCQGYCTVGRAGVTSGQHWPAPGIRNTIPHKGLGGYMAWPAAWDWAVL